MRNFRVELIENGETFETLADILPESGGLDILIVAKVPALTSVAAGHYFQGRQGQLFWNRLKQAGLLSTCLGEYEDEALLRHQIGIMDIVKKPRGYGDEPTAEEYRRGVDRIMRAVFAHQPKILMFVYKRVLDQLLQQGFREQAESQYGFNDQLDHLFRAKVFVFPMPGTPCTREMAEKAMKELARECSST